MITLAPPKELKLADPRLKATVTQSGKSFTVSLQAEKPALWTWLELDGVDARCSDNFVHVTPGAPVEITVTPARSMKKAEFTRLLRVRSVFDTY